MPARNSKPERRWHDSPRWLFARLPSDDELPSGAELEGDEPSLAGEPVWDPFDPDEQEPEPEYGDFWLERDDEDDR